MKRNVNSAVALAAWMGSAAEHDQAGDQQDAADADGADEQRLHASDDGDERADHRDDLTARVALPRAVERAVPLQRERAQPVASAVIVLVISSVDFGHDRVSHRMIIVHVAQQRTAVDHRRPSSRSTQDAVPILRWAPRISAAQPKSSPLRMISPTAAVRLPSGSAKRTIPRTST